MGYKIIRLDGKEDKITSHVFDSYSDAYDLLDSIYGDLCCSDADYEDIVDYNIVENKENTKIMSNKNWTPTQKDNQGIITNIYELFKEELTKLQKETGCPDSFIYDLVGRIQNEWRPNSCHSIVRNQEKKN